VLLIPIAAAAVPGGQTLVQAAKEQDGRAVETLLKQHVDVNARQPDGATALHWAVHWDDLRTAGMLMHAGADVNAANDLGVTPLMLACTNAKAAMVDQLLAAGADPNATAFPTAETPLMIAARSGNPKVVKSLLGRGAKVNAVETAHGQTALMWAVANRHPAVVQELIEGGADVNARSAVGHQLVNKGNRYAGQDEIGDVAEVPIGGFTPLLFAARYGEIESGKLLLAAGARLDDRMPDGTSALVLAAHSGQSAFALFLLDRGADANDAASGYTALHAAVLRGEVELVRALVAHGAEPNVLLRAGTAVNRFSKDYAFNNALIGATPFWLAARFLEPEIMRTLVASGANPHTPTPDGTTPLMAAAGVVAAGVGLGRMADRRERRLDPLELATRTQSDDEERRALDAVTTIVNLGADVNATNHRGDTALHGATSAGFPNLVKWLVDHGANVDAKNERGQTPLSIATAARAREDGSADARTADVLRRLGGAK
jgi:ankyrin repeat protein